LDSKLLLLCWMKLIDFGSFSKQKQEDYYFLLFETVHLFFRFGNIEKMGAIILIEPV
jgi:hypothetical protein